MLSESQLKVIERQARGGIPDNVRWGLASDATGASTQGSPTRPRASALVQSALQDAAVHPGHNGRASGAGQNSMQFLDERNVEHVAYAGMDPTLSSMTLERLKHADFNGLLGKAKRNAITGTVYLKEAEQIHDFNLVDFAHRTSIKGEPIMLAGDTNLYLPKTMNYRTWVYHDKYNKALANSTIGKKSDAFLWESLNERCIDFDTRAGMYSSVVLLFPLVPFTILIDDAVVTVTALITTFLCLGIAVVTNSYYWYFWHRFMSLPIRLAFLIVVFVKMGSGGLGILGSLLSVVVLLADFWMGDVNVLMSGGFYCRYEVIKTLPNQVFVCRRDGDNARERARAIRIPESVTGIADNGDNSVCLIANFEGILMELLPVDKAQDATTFQEEHTKRSLDTSLGLVRFFGADIFYGNIKTIQDYEAMQNNLSHLRSSNLLDPEAKKDQRLKMLQKDINHKHGDLKVEDIV